MFTTRSNRRYGTFLVLGILLLCVPVTALAVNAVTSKKTRVVKCVKKKTKRSHAHSSKKKNAKKCTKRKKSSSHATTSTTSSNSSQATTSSNTSDTTAPATGSSASDQSSSNQVAPVVDDAPAATGSDPDPTPEPAIEPSSADSTSEPQFADGVIKGIVTDTDIDEASGIVASRKNAHVLWVHNDSGDSARLFAINTEGELLGTYEISGATATDWEDISIGPGPTAGTDYLYIGDTGDNNHNRPSGVQIYRIAEPTVSADQPAEEDTLSGVETLTVQYPSSAPTDSATGTNFQRDSETLMVDPQSGDIYLLSKRTTHSQIFSYPFTSSWTGGVKTLTYHGELDWNWAVSGEFSPDGDEIIVKSGTTVYMYDRPAGTTPTEAMLDTTEWTLPYTLEPQGEAITFDSSGLGYYTLSEGTNQPLYYYERTG